MIKWVFKWQVKGYKIMIKGDTHSSYRHVYDGLIIDRSEFFFLKILHIYRLNSK